MGADICGNAGLGICVSGSELLTTKMVKAYNHDYNNNFKFDPITGKALWREEKVMKQISGGHKIICINDHEDAWIVAMKVVSVKSCRFGRMHSGLNFNSTVTEYEKFATDMLDAGLWNDTFGLYTWIEVCE